MSGCTFETGQLQAVSNCAARSRFLELARRFLAFRLQAVTTAYMQHPRKLFLLPFVALLATNSCLRLHRARCLRRADFPSWVLTPGEVIAIRSTVIITSRSDTEPASVSIPLSASRTRRCCSPWEPSDHAYGFVVQVQLQRCRQPVLPSLGVILWSSTLISSP